MSVPALAMTELARDDGAVVEPIPVTHGDLLTAQTLEQHFREMLPGATVLDLDDLTDGVAVGCVDGRRRDCVAGAPGGNAGLLVVLLAAWEQWAGRPLSPESVDRIFRLYLDDFGSFYVHTDRSAQLRLATTLQVDPASVDLVTRRPPAESRARMLELLVDPAHVGCGHLRLLLEEPEAYGVRGDLVRAVLRAFFTSLWDGDPRVTLDILDGAHMEGGVVRIRTDDRLAPDAADGPGGEGRPTLVTACPHHGTLELFVYHPDAVEWLQSLHALFLARRRLIPAGRISECIQDQQRLGQRQLEATLRRLAAGLPVFDVRIEASTDTVAPARVAVRFEGHIAPHTSQTTDNA